MRKYAVPCIISLPVAVLYNIIDQIFIRLGRRSGGQRRHQCGVPTDRAWDVMGTAVAEQIISANMIFVLDLCKTLILQGIINRPSTRKFVVYYSFSPMASRIADS